MSSTWLHGSTPSGQSGGLVRKEGNQIDFICSGTEVGADFPKLTITIHRESNPGVLPVGYVLDQGPVRRPWEPFQLELVEGNEKLFGCDTIQERMNHELGYYCSLKLRQNSGCCGPMQVITIDTEKWANPGLFIYTWQRRMAKTSIEWVYSQSLVNRIADKGTTTKPWAQENLRDFNLFIQKEMDEKKYLYTG
ncbi:predicted protein [Histoplasma capsulatum G186AR]|uniref:Uncharacterized protein n=1 Tax=Ajellomyces capsulatus (strain G186AR / H82 / ATCC MYA-2454 / RMSCC 2432) TaxID=447093 RepID=C0NE32_AJECG|nr:uncharacterized protein HCBG_02125 [Histoplasma capsulatum G186AR]EEH10480.1 predicted protein [Histoplasma capsulatum G186AR]